MTKTLSHADREKVRRMEALLAESLRKDRAKPSRCTLADDGTIIVQVSGYSAGLAYAIGALTGEDDVLRRFTEEVSR